MTNPTTTRSPAGTCWSCGEPAPMHRTGCTLSDPVTWQSDHQRRILEWLDAEHGTSLAGEFPFGCDTIQHVAEALIALRAERRFTAEEAVERVRKNLLSLPVAAQYLSEWGKEVEARCYHMRRALSEETS